jgi:hypothetical protein
MLPLRDKIRAICHSLKMDNLAGVDPNRVADLEARKKALPGAEKISAMSHSDLEELRVRTERMLFDIDNARNSRTKDFAMRHMVDKGLPPRRRPILGSLMSPNWLKRAEDMLEKHDEIMNELISPSESGMERADSLAPSSGSIHPGCGGVMEPVTGTNDIRCKRCGAVFSDNLKTHKATPNPVR